MPQCRCFHKYLLERTGTGAYRLELEMEGRAGLEDVLKHAGLVSAVSIEGFFFDSYALSGVLDEVQLRGFLEILRSTIIVDLRPLVKECYALAPYTVFSEQEQARRTTVGEMMYRAKYGKDASASSELGHKLKDFITRHPRISNAHYVTTPPKSDPMTPDIAGQWAEYIAAGTGLRRLVAGKMRQTIPQKELEEAQDENAAVASVADSVQVKNVERGASVLILDDTIRSGGTIKEMARALLQEGAGDGFGLSAAKDAKFTQGGIELSEDRWE